MNKEEVYKSLQKRFNHFINMHNFTEAEKKQAMIAFGKNVMRPFDIGFGWHGSRQGYDYFYFLSLRWLMELIKLQKAYEQVYNISDACRTFNHLIQYAETPHTLEGIKEDIVAIDNYRSIFDRKRNFYCNFNKKIREKFGN